MPATALAVRRQREDCREIATSRGWTVVGEYVDNSASASGKKARKDYDRMVEAYKAGEFDALVCWDLDRLTRNPRQLEDWIDAAQDRELLLVTANGEADLSTDAGRLFARIKASVARAEIERKGARQRRAALQRAEHGKPPLGVRLTGYTVAGELIEHEAAVVREMFERFHAGESLHSIAAALNQAGIGTRNGGRWNPSTIRTILVNPRYCGRAVYCGTANGHQGGWQPIVDETVWDLVNARLADPRRRKQVGTHRKHLGAGLYLCDVCEHLVRSHTGGGVLRYRCPEGHLIRSAAPIDEAVLRVLRGVLARREFAGLLAVPESSEARKIADEVKRLRGRLAQTEADYDNDVIDGLRYKTKTEKLKADLEKAERAQARLLAGSGAASPVLSAPDPVAAFDKAALGTQREILGLLMEVRLLPAPRGRKGFDPDTLKIEPREQRVS
ncbi:MAG: recombinase family protein [Streptosporangiaceae bacterium]